ncbi:glycosyl hydrolase [Aspergillus heteromorphus CBS 117.55]|uniref:Glycosyl hydrolase n=1 Tax=Aspergillus heteromorphus CBS 117.55 TaxID=1448321 RepID=A0A317V628_9EURO|nr:glycosyl hydrolase [Aspergillus heteromorphus CBS 117.55]PWY69506.1 glycosyl hydrolase [Aspergillus heteromorphus CBS 117.55]
MVLFQRYLCLLPIWVATVLGNNTPTSPDVLTFVDPLIGSTNGGNVFAGASLPYGMAKAVADVDGQNTGGFSTDGSNVTGFSALHDSGTGGNPSLGNFPLFPQLCPDDALDNCKFPKAARAVHYLNDSVVARPGYFALSLENGIHAEMTTTHHAALYRFNFPSATTDEGAPLSPMILLDLTDLWDSRQNASVSVDAQTGQIKANGTFLPSFGAGSYMSYFCADFEGASIRDTGIWVNNRAGTEPKELFVTRGFNNFYLQAGGFVRFQRPDNGTVTVRVGVSYISTEKACENARTEIPDPLGDFERIREYAENTWREKLGPISLETGGVSEEIQTTFWSGVYRTMLDPQDLTGENPLWESSEPYFDSFYCIWDSFRAQHPLLTIIDPHTQSRMVRSLLDTYRHEGWLPDCRMSLCKGWTQGGSNADVVLADAYVKNLTGIDWDVAYEAMVNDAENEPQEWSYEGRGGLQSWKQLNYIPYLDFDYLGFGTNSRSISRTLEYAYNNFCLATVARGLGKYDDSLKYLARANNWRNLFKADQTSFFTNGTDTGFVGFFQPKYLNGTWGHQDPIACSTLSSSWCSLTSNPSETFESSIWEYQFYVPHDIPSLITHLGGASTFTSRLTFFHTSGLADLSNEPVFLTIFQYHYAHRPALSSHRIHTLIPSLFNASSAGLPGNDDSGAMGAFSVFAMLGLFPNPGQNVYLITPPFFPQVSVTNPVTNCTATVRNVGFDPEYRRIYVQSATLDGEVYTRNWIGHEFFTQGGVLELVLGEEESGWGTGGGDGPPGLVGEGDD